MNDPRGDFSASGITVGEEEEFGPGNGLRDISLAENLFPAIKARAWPVGSKENERSAQVKNRRIFIVSVPPREVTIKYGKSPHESSIPAIDPSPISFKIELGCRNNDYDSSQGGFWEWIPDMISDGRLPLNKAEALERIGGDEAFLQELLGMYDEEYAEKTAALDNALNKKDFGSIRELGHSLKGASANLSLPGLRAAAFELETAGRDRDVKRAAKAFVRLRDEYRRLKGYLEACPLNKGSHR